MKATEFSTRILKWFKQHGRHDLPWQKNNTPYRVWVSEVMLQQTQVSTVIEYYQRFMKRFPSLKSLAIAHEDEALAHWSGLGYYARARNLHKTAIIVYETFNGRFPKTQSELESLPGIGRSTAGAILSLAIGIPAPILDGNVKRVLARFAAIDGWTGQTATLKQLWELSSKYTPQTNCRDYNQAMMDLGASLCSRTKPDCLNCPLHTKCQAYIQGNPEKYPIKKPKKARPQKTTQLLILTNPQQEILFEKRPHSGIWGGLWSFPEYNDNEEKLNDFCTKNFGCKALSINTQAIIKHQFSHFELLITPQIISVKPLTNKAMEHTQHIWHKEEDHLPGGIAAPVAHLLKNLYK